MPSRTPGQKLQWMYRNAKLEDLMKAYPEIWREVGKTLVGTLEENRTEELREYARKAKSEEDLWLDRIRKLHYPIFVKGQVDVPFIVDQFGFVRSIRIG